MANKIHEEWLKYGPHDWNGRRKLIKFSPDLSGTNFGEILEAPGWHVRPGFDQYDFSGADLTRANFNKAKFGKADLSRSIAYGTSFIRANLKDTNFALTQLANANFEGAVATADVVFSLQQKSAINVDMISVIDISAPRLPSSSGAALKTEPMASEGLYLVQ
jgi:hypothetical protein